MSNYQLIWPHKPNKGDTVRVSFEGEYSHQGDSTIAAGFHIVKVGKRDVALPPDIEFEVVKCWRPPEPPVGTIVHNTCTGNFWQRDSRDLLGGYWECISALAIDRVTWRDLLDVSGNGRALIMYHPAPAVT